MPSLGGGGINPVKTCIVDKLSWAGRSTIAWKPLSRIETIWVISKLLKEWNCANVWKKQNALPDNPVQAFLDCLL